MKKTICNFPKLTVLALFLFACFLSGCLKMEPVMPGAKNSSNTTTAGSNNTAPVNTGTGTNTGNTGGGTGAGTAYVQFYNDPNGSTKDYSGSVEINNQTYYLGTTLGDCSQKLNFTPNYEGKIIFKLTARNNNSLEEAMGGTAPVTVRDVYIYASELKPGCNTVELFWSHLGVWLKVRQ